LCKANLMGKFGVANDLLGCLQEACSWRFKDWPLELVSNREVPTAEWVCDVGVSRDSFEDLSKTMSVVPGPM